MRKTTTVLILAALVLTACQANQSAFAPDISTTIRPQSSEPVNVNDDDIRVTVRNQGKINAFEITVDITAGGDQVREKTVAELPSSSEEVIRFEKGGTLTDHCGNGSTTLSVSASPSVKDLDPANNDASQRITC